jgi:hypothetical protein
VVFLPFIVPCLRGDRESKLSGKGAWKRLEIKMALLILGNRIFRLGLRSIVGCLENGRSSYPIRPRRR